MNLVNSSVSHEMLTPLKCVVSLCKQSIQCETLPLEVL